ncbi:MAG: O-antigen ligase family protein [Polyangiaceae bacterium]
MLSLLVAGSVLAVGGAPPVVVVVLAPLAFVAALLCTWMPSAGRGHSLAPFAVFLGLAAYSILQAIPTPAALLKALSPVAADVWARALVPLGEEVTTRSISLDRGASLLEALKWASYACTFFAATSVARRRGAEFGVAIVFVSAVVVATVTIGHQLLEARRLYGFYRPITNVDLHHIGPLANPNNLAGYLNLGLFSGLGLLFGRRALLPRTLTTIGCVILVAVGVLSGSRGGLIAMLVGTVGFSILVFVTRLRRDADGAEAGTVRRAIWLLPGILALGGGLVLLGLNRTFLTEISMSGGGLDKFKIPLWTKPLILDFKWVGIGRGAFESVFPAYHPPVKGNVVFTHPENVVVQWSSEWGLVGVVALIALLVLFRPNRLAITRSALNAGVLVGVGALLLHNLADLSLELFGVGTAVATLLGSLWGDERRHGGRGEFKERPWFIRGVVACAAALAIVVAARGDHGVTRDRRSISNLVTAAADKADRMSVARPAIRQAMLAHPADYYFPLAGAMVALESGENPIPWIQRALERGPVIGRTHFVLSEILSRRGMLNQSLLEMRTAVECEPALASAVGRFAVQNTRVPADLLRAVPTESPVPVQADVLEAMSERLDRPEDLEAAEALDRETIERDPSRRSPRERIVTRRLRGLELHSAPCEDRAPCVDELAAQAEEFKSRWPKSSRGAQILAELARVEGRPEEAHEILREACALPSEAAACLKLLAPLATLDELPDVLSRLTSVSCTNRADCGAAHDWAAALLESRRQWAQAFTSRERAIEQGVTDERLLAAANAAEVAGLYGDAIRVLQRLKPRRKGDASIDARIREDEAKKTGPLR